MPTDIKTDKISSTGPKLLRDYIDFAINGTRVLLAQNTISDDVLFDSPFEESVYDFLIAQGYRVATQVGCSGYRIDMAVYHPEYNGRFAIGIECDGAAYHSARTARERDRLRQAVLENMGWRIYRIWSTDWIKDTISEKNRLLEAINNAISSYQESPIIRNANKVAQSSDYIEITDKSQSDILHESYDKFKSSYALYKPHEIPVKDFEKTLLNVIQSGYGSIKINELYKFTARYGYLWQRVGSNIKAQFDIALSNLQKKKLVSVNGEEVSSKK